MPATTARPGRPPLAAAPLPPLERRRVDCGEVALDCRLAGPVDAPLVVLLHGFPESWYSWRHQVAALADRFRVVVPSLRGYGESDRPAPVAAYRMDRLTGDVHGLVRALGREHAHVVGHDWGGAIAWAFAIDHPTVCARLAVCNCPHPAVFTRALRGNLRQLLRSWYMFLFQVPRLPERLLRARDLAAIERGFRTMVRRRDVEVFTDADIDEIKNALRPPGAMRAAVNYYRAAFRNAAFMRRYQSPPPIACPTLLVWAEEDDALGKELSRGTEPWVHGPFSVRYIPACSHWVQQERPGEVNAALLDFLSA